MNHKLRITLVVLASFFLSACGSDSSSSTPVASPPAVVDPAPVDPPADPPAPVMESLTLSGQVTDMPIANATVVITVNGVEFTAPNPTTADGSFEVDIETDDPDALVLCEAFDPSGPARFSALLNNFAGLQDSASEEGVAEEVNITNVTTAQFLLAQQQATDGSIDSIEELQTVAEQVDPTELLELSAAIKVVIDSVAGVALPDEFTDVQQLAQAIVDGTTSFLADIETVNPGILEDTIDEVLSDGFATTAFKAESVAGVYIDSNGNDIVVLYEDGSGFFGEEDLFDDGFGGTYQGQIVEAVTWSVLETGALQIVFTETQDTDTVVMLNDAGGVLTLHSTSLEDNGSREYEDTFSVVRFRFAAGGFDAENVPGSYGDPEDEFEGTEYSVFQADGSGYEIDVATGELDDYFSWEVNEAGELLLVGDGLPDNGESVASDEREVIRLLEGSTDEQLILLAVEYELEGDAVIEIEAFPVDYTAEILTGPMPDMANSALLTGKTYAYKDGNELGIVTLGADGVFEEIYQDFDDVDGPDFGEESGEWFIDSNGTIHVSFDEVDGTVETDRVDVVSGLGGDRMVLLTEDEVDGAESELVLDRVTSFANTEITGDWNIVEDGFAQTDTITFNVDGTGSYFESGVVDDTFSWSVNSAGTLVITLNDPGNDVYADHVHLLADSNADNLHVFVVYRRNGELDNDSDDPQGPPEVIFEINLVR